MDTEKELNPAELARYQRHLTLPEIGESGQSALRRARILVVGAGGLGSPAAFYLAAAGVGKLGIADADRVDLSNLQRQILHRTADIGLPKVDSARARLLELDPALEIVTLPLRVTRKNVLSLIADYDIIVDGSDNFPTRYALNDAAARVGKPLVHGSVFRFQGQVSIFGTPDGPCYRCLFPKSPQAGEIPNCAEAGVLGVLPGVVGTVQATEAIKLVVNRGESLVGRLWTWDALSARAREFRVAKDPKCPACSVAARNAEWNDTEENEVCAMDHPDEITPSELKEKRESGEPLLILDVREPFEYKIANLGGLLIPLSELDERLGEIDKEIPIVVICHHGVRSRLAAHYLKENGFEKVMNLSGGIDRWSIEVDPRTRRY